MILSNQYLILESNCPLIFLRDFEDEYFCVILFTAVDAGQLFKSNFTPKPFMFNEKISLMFWQNYCH